MIDGNIGIGGDPVALLARCAEIVRDGGRVVVETHVDRSADRTFTAHVADGDGNRRGGVPWAEVGVDALLEHAATAGLRARRSWTAEGRTFCELVA